jgi:23S rRNA pseudouridine955/2504/2580 synthase
MDPTDPTRSKTDSSKPGAPARTVRVPDDREGQRLDNFLLGQLKGAPGRWSTSWCARARCA